MRSTPFTTISALTASVIAASLSLASEGPTVRVALLDMTAMMSPGMMGHGMMAPGMMGRRMMGSGMMGMMGPGMTGMMGSGMPMHGMMSVRINPSSVKSGKVSFDVTNLSQSIVHEMMIVAVDTPDAPLPYDYGTWRVLEDQVKVAGDAKEMQPNSSKILEVTLSPGSYLLLCNVAGHYAAGMVAPFYVSP
jgi:uncharacterized cupredoxin-like copper-binding protein